MAMGGLYYEEFSPGMRFEHMLCRTVAVVFRHRCFKQRNEELGVCKRTVLMKRKGKA